MFKLSSMRVLLILVLTITLSGCIPGKERLVIHEEEQNVAIWLQNLESKTVQEQARLASVAYTDPSMPAEIRDRALYLLASRPSSQLNMAQSRLSVIYEEALPSEKMNMERILFADFYTLDSITLTQICQAILPMQSRIFPYSMALYVGAERGILKNSEEIKKNFAESNPFLYPSVTGASFYRMEDNPEIQEGVNIALLLPLTGNLASVGNQIKAGADLAQLHLRVENYDVRIHYIDTQNPQWTEQLNQLPEDCVIIGGPLEVDKFNMLNKTSFISEHMLFGFLPTLPPSVGEGQGAWRFFASPKDQIKSMLDVTEWDFGIKSYGVLTPDDAYGQRMAELFTNEASKRGFHVTTTYYPLGEISAWSNISAKFLNSRPNKNPERLPVVGATFGAIFLPDVWRNSELLISTLNYHGAQEKIILGTLLWEQGFTSIPISDAQVYARTIFPSVLNSLQETPETEIFLNGMEYMKVSPSDWAVLGFDFVLMSAELGLENKITHNHLNKMLAELNVSYAGAPISWDSNGIASRQLFVQQPTPAGALPYHKGMPPRPLEKIPQPVKVDYDFLLDEDSSERVQDAVDSLINDILGR